MSKEHGKQTATTPEQLIEAAHACGLRINNLYPFEDGWHATGETRLMIRIPEFLTTAPRHLFFTGKGGVGKTPLACASAVLLADIGRRVLLVSTDPASNLDAVLGTKLANSPTPVAGVPNLRAMNIDPEATTRAALDG